MRLIAFLLFNVHAGHAFGDAGEQLVADESCGLRHVGHGVAFAIDHHFVTLVDRESRNIQHAHVHADFADDGHFLPLNDDSAFAITQLARVAVGVSDGDNGHLRVAFQPPAAVVADGFAGRDVLHLRDDGFQGDHIVQLRCHFSDFGASVQTDAKAHHVELRFWEPVNAGAVEDVAQNLVVEGGAELVGHLLEQGNLVVRVGVLAWVLGSGQMREHGGDVQLRVLFHKLNQLRNVLLVESQPVHAGVEFDMDVELLDLRVFFEHFDQFAEVIEIENFGFEVLSDHHIETVRFGAQHDDGGLDVALAQAHALVGVCYRQIVNVLRHKFVHQFHIAETVGVGFHHGHHFSVGAQVGAVEVEVVGERGQTDIEDGKMRHVLQFGHNVLEVGVARAFHQDALVGELRQVADKFLSRSEKLAFRTSEAMAVRQQMTPDTDEPVDVVLLKSPVKFLVILVVEVSHLLKVREDERLVGQLGLGVQEVQSGIQ